MPWLGAAVHAVPGSVTQTAADGAGLLTWAATPTRRRATAANYAALLHQAPRAPAIHRLVRQAFKHYGRMALAFFALTQTSDDDLLAQAQVSGREQLDEALRHGNGAILTMPHLGNWDLAARLCLALGYPLTAVVEDDWSAAFAGQARTGSGLRVLPRARSLRPLLRALARNEPVALLCDVVPPGAHGVPVCFAGQRAFLPVGPARLAIASRAPLIPCAAVTLADGRPGISATDAIYPPAGTSAGKALPQQVQFLMQ
ncbi:MAG TPA: lysophospholipid acyltransferase family protein, partial [Chloroflexota bacterium]|nr:lysophospholipid acyltransferase family protein [Chloroflexota bacterium]